MWTEADVDVEIDLVEGDEMIVRVTTPVGALDIAGRVAFSQSTALMFKA